MPTQYSLAVSGKPCIIAMPSYGHVAYDIKINYFVDENTHLGIEKIRLLLTLIDAMKAAINILKMKTCTVTIISINALFVRTILIQIRSTHTRTTRTYARDGSKITKMTKNCTARRKIALKYSNRV